VQIRNHAADTVYEEIYDKLLLAPGGSPVKPPIPGADHPAIHTLWTIPDTDRIRKVVDQGEIKTALVVGAGFIGLEMAENLHARGIRVIVVEMADQALSPLDYEMAALVHSELQQQGIELHLAESVTAFEPAAEGAIVARLASGREIGADLVMLPIGVRPNTGFLEGSGIALGPRGHIVVDEDLRTSAPHVYAAGDAIEVINPLSGKKAAIPLAGPANKQGRIAAGNLSGVSPRIYDGTLGTAIEARPVGAGNDKTIVVFSGDLDKAIASFIIANGARAMGRKVTMFFTFWGLNVLRKPGKTAGLKKTRSKKPLR